jgi:hypothetical protein
VSFIADTMEISKVAMKAVIPEKLPSKRPSRKGGQWRENIQLQRQRYKDADKQQKCALVCGQYAEAVQKGGPLLGVEPAAKGGCPYAAKVGATWRANLDCRRSVEKAPGRRAGSGIRGL